MSDMNLRYLLRHFQGFFTLKSQWFVLFAKLKYYVEYSHFQQFRAKHY